MGDTKICPYCFEIIKRQALRCRYCQADLTLPSSATPSITVGGIKGVTIGGSGHHIEGGIHLVTTLGELDTVDEPVKQALMSKYKSQIQNSPEKAKIHLALGLCYLDLRLHNLSINSFNIALEKNPQEAKVLYYLALAYIGGKRPRTLNLSVIKSIENYLRNAIHLGDSPSHYLYLWALIKYDYYLLNGLRVTPPSLEELLLIAQNQNISHSEIRQMLKHVPIPNNNPIKEMILRRLQMF